ncbi:MAG: hypothetical protein P8049_09045 [Gemmatimonadota bacterium]
MSVNLWLVSFVVLLGLAGAWRLYRWRWRPRLELETLPGGNMRVANVGSATAKNCRAALLRLDRFEDGGWRRLDSRGEARPLRWSDGPTHRDLRPGESAEIQLMPGEAAASAGRYRLEVAVIDGEETRARFEIEREEER